MHLKSLWQFCEGLERKRKKSVNVIFSLTHIRHFNVTLFSKLSYILLHYNIM